MPYRARITVLLVRQSHDEAVEMAEIIDDATAVDLGGGVREGLEVLIEEITGEEYGRTVERKQQAKERTA